MRFKKVTLFTNQLSKIRTFYTTKVGVSLKSDESDSFSFALGWTELTFIQSPKRYIYHYCFLIPRNKLIEAVQFFDEIDFIQSNNTSIHHLENFNANSVYFLDGGGNIAEFIAHEELDNDTSVPFSLTQVLGLNEIGIPSSNPRFIDEQLSELLNAEIWTGLVDRFAATGTREASFLLVNNKEKDKWFPTDLFPQNSKFQIYLDVGNSPFNLEFTGQRIKNIT